MTPDGTIRAFIAIELPDTIQRELAKLQEALSPGLHRGVKWVPPESIHLTLKFLGNVHSDQVPKLKTAIEKATSQTELFILKLATLGAFPNLHKPEVIWCGLNGDTNQLGRLQRLIEAELSPLGFPSEARPFSPHLTVARLRRDIDSTVRDRLTAGLREYTAIPDLAFTVKSVSLMQSRLTPTGALYTQLAEFPFGSTFQIAPDQI